MKVAAEMLILAMSMFLLAFYVMKILVIPPGAAVDILQGAHEIQQKVPQE